MAAAVARPRSEIESDLALARSRLAELERELAAVSSRTPSPAAAAPSDDPPRPRRGRTEYPLSLREYERYGRQMLLPQVGLPGQLKLKHAHVLVVGAGGLGCPVLLYLAAAGVGEVTILDHDKVELSNLHRQVVHTEQRVGMSKAESAKIALEALNSDVKVNAHQVAFVPSVFHDDDDDASTSSAIRAALTTRGTFTLVVDCTDNPATRHFLNAYAVAMSVPLVSGGAVRAEGTVGVYALPLEKTKNENDNDPEVEVEARGPCYACVFPPAPSLKEEDEDDDERTELERDLAAERASLVGTGACSDEGVLGINCGVVGLAMAAEAVKVLLGIAKPTLQLFSPLSSCPYRVIKTRARKPTCPACGTLPDPDPVDPVGRGGGGSTTPESRWDAFLGSSDGAWPGWQDPLCTRPPGVGEAGRRRRDDDERITVDELKTWTTTTTRGEVVRIVDTRPAPEFGIVHLEGSVNVPFAKLLKDPRLAFGSEEEEEGTIAVVCRRGNDSLLASRALRRWSSSSAERASSRGGRVRIVDVVGGLTAYARTEPGFPVY
ncbi:hypothetical protein JCM11491_003206 [Sporobolomyces phaffii]